MIDVKEPPGWVRKALKHQSHRITYIKGDAVQAISELAGEISRGAMLKF